MPLGRLSGSSRSTGLSAGDERVRTDDASSSAGSRRRRRTRRRRAARSTGRPPSPGSRNSDSGSIDGCVNEGGPSQLSWLRWLSPYVRRYRTQVIATLVASILWMGAVVAAPLVQKVIVDDAIVNGTRSLPVWVLVLGVLGLGRFLTAAIWRYEGGRVALGVTFDLRNELYDRLQRLDAAGHAHLQSGQVVSRANSDLLLVQQAVSWLPLLIGSLLNIIVALGVMVVLSPVLAGVVAVVVVVVFVLSRRMKDTLYASGWDAQQREADMVTVVEEAVTGVRVVKAFGQERGEFDRFTGRLNDVFGSRLRAIRIRAPFLAALQAAPLVGQVVVLLVGGYLAMRGHLSVGTFLAFAGYLANLAGTARILGTIVTAGPLARAGTERIAQLLGLVSAVRDKPGAVAPSRRGGGVRFESVSFSYPQTDDPVLSELSLNVEPGETVAIVGPSGAGKSTALQLILRLRDVSSGSVIVEDVDVRDWQLGALRSRTGIVFENSFLFSTSIAANIAYARPDAAIEDIEAVARAAAVHEFIIGLPDGYDTQVGEEGLALSGGQRQRIALARALLADPDVLILDDATSAVDVGVEQQIHDNLKPLLADRTTILVAYRESTVRLADRVILLDRGGVTDEGTHEELLARSELYQRLFGDDQDAAPADPVSPTAGNLTHQAWLPHQPDSSTWMGEPPTADLLATVASLAPAIDEPEVDPEAEAARSEGFRLATFLRPHARALVIGLLLVLIDAIAALLGPLLVREGIDSALVTRSSMALIGVCAVYLAVALVDWWDLWITTLYTNRTTERLLYAIRIRIFAHLQKLGVEYYDRTQTGRIMTRITGDVDTVSQLFQVGLINALVALVTCLGMTVVLFTLNSTLALVVFAVVPPAALATSWYRRTAGPAYDRARERMSALNSVLHESIAGVRVTQAFVREDVNYARFRELAAGQRHESDIALRTTSRYVSIIELLSVWAVAATLLVGGRLVEHRTLMIGTLLAFLLYLAQVFAPIQQLSAVFDVYQRAKVGLSRIGTLLAQTTSISGSEVQASQDKLRGEIVLEGVSLQYPGVRAPALNQVDLQIAAGQRVAFVGQTGAGKSTIAKLMTRFYDPTEGRVLIDGKPLSNLDPVAFRRQLGYVPQEPFLFSRSIRDNIAYGRPDVADEMVEAAARAVGAHGFIARLEGGYHHVIAERGRSLSAGQRQLLCLARALLVDPAILILDEATSSLDLASEAQVNRAMKAASAGRTTIVIAHRPQSLHWVDRIITVHEGNVVADCEPGHRDVCHPNITPEWSDAAGALTCGSAGWASDGPVDRPTS
jgi:ATP-binding cassette subfamily B protein